MKEALSRELQSTATRVNGRLEELFGEFATKGNHKRFATALNDAPELFREVASLTLRGGKRLRAALVIHGGALFDEGAIESSDHLDVAAVMELIQTYLLIHDDIIDDDDSRRGGPTVHVALQRDGRTKQEAVGLAILAGDLAKAVADVIVGELDVPPTIHQSVRSVIARMHLDVVHGQVLDATGATDAETIARHKTASYTTIGPLLAGAALSGASEGQLNSLAKCALPLGVAFQIRDDLLSLFGDASQTGKPCGSDLTGGKRNWLIEKSLAVSEGKNRTAIESAWGNLNATNEAVELACRSIEKAGVRWLAEERIESLVNHAVRGLKVMHCRQPALKFMEELAEYLGDRQH